MKEATQKLFSQMDEYRKRCDLANERDYLKASGWISVKDRLPEESVCVLVASNLNDSPYIDCWFDKDAILWRHTNDKNEKVQYWMELPDIPRLEPRKKSEKMY